MSSAVEHGELRAADLATVAEQLGREPTIPFTVVARCTGGHPLVIRNAPRDADGAPFPTTYWLTCPDAARAVSRLESEGGIGELNARYEADADFRAAVDAAHADAARDRARDLPDAAAWGGVGGTRRGIKCLHAHYANHLGGGDDVVGRWVAARVEPIHADQRSGRVAAIDQGTNSCRLTVLEPAADPSGDPTELARDMIITRLGKGVDRTGRFDPDALARTVGVIGRYCRRARALGAERIRVGATSATRDAENRGELSDAVRELAGTELEVITGEREAALSFLGGTRGLDPQAGPFLVLDIGGGSTEFVVGASPGVADQAISIQMGSVRLTERAIRNDPPTAEDLERLRALANAGIDEAARAVRVERARTMVSVAGTATTLRAVALGLGRYDPDRIHRTWLDAAEAERVLAGLAAMTNAERAAIPVMAPGRGDVIVAGATILVEVMRRFGFRRTLVSETDILDGLGFEALGVR
jgi:exopolyphosphatase/guanosine-5'-triphosphate,3'-diphosphate pyrophosphatase